MSRLQVVGKPILQRLIHGFWLPLTSDEQATLAAWAVMSTIILEAAHPETAATTYDQRAAFKNSGTVIPKAPDNWSVWIGRYDGINSGAHNHAAWAIGELEEGQELPDVVVPPDHQVTGFVVGKLFVLTYSAPYNLGIPRSIEAGAFALANGIQLVWPNGEKYNSAPSRVLNPLEWQVITRSIPANFGIEPRYGA